MTAPPRFRERFTANRDSEKSILPGANSQGKGVGVHYNPVNGGRDRRFVRSEARTRTGLLWILSHRQSRSIDYCVRAPIHNVYMGFKFSGSAGWLQGNVLNQRVDTEGSEGHKRKVELREHIVRN